MNLDSAQTKPIQEREWYLLFLAAILVLAFSALPYIVGYSSQTEDQIFSGAVLDRQDYAVHLATMHIGESGSWKYVMLFTSEEQPGAYVKQGYIFLGHIARLFHLELAQTYQIARLFFGFVLIVSIYLLSARIFIEPFWRFLATFLGVLGSGLGWLQLVFNWIPQSGISPIDFWLLDGYVYLGILSLPHFSAVSVGLVLMILVSDRYLSGPATGLWGVAALAAFLIQFVMPYAPILADSAIAAMFMYDAILKRKFDWKAGVYLAGLALIQVPLFIYNLVVFRDSATWASFLQQNVTLSPPPVYYVFGFALLWLAAVLGVFTFIKNSRRSASMVHAGSHARKRILFGLFYWMVAAMVLAYLPWNLQRRFLLAYSLPLGLLAGYGLESLGCIKELARIPRWIRKRGNVFAVLFLGITCISPITFTLGNALLLSGRPADRFDPVGAILAADWLAEKASADEVVLSDERTAQLLAASGRMRVYLGHPIETLGYQHKLRQVDGLYKGTLSWDRVCTMGVNWIVYGPREAEIGPVKPAADCIAQVYDAQSVRIYAVNRKR